MTQHPVLGHDRELSAEPALCSTCSEEIPEDHVPLILWSENGRLAWQYCDVCEDAIFDLRAAAAKPVQAQAPPSQTPSLGAR